MQPVRLSRRDTPAFANACFQGSWPFPEPLSLAIVADGTWIPATAYLTVPVHRKEGELSWHNDMSGWDPFFAMNNGSTSCNHCFSPPMCLRTKPRIRRLTKDSIRKQLHLYSFCVYWISYIRHVLVNLIIRYNVVLLCNTLQGNVMML